MSNGLDLDKFKEIIKEYSANFSNPPTNTKQIAQFCKTKSYKYKYGQLNPYFSLWKKQSKAKVKVTKKDNNTPSGTPNGNSPNTSGSDNDDINWEAFWDGYTTKYDYPPKKPIHLFSFAQQAGSSVTYKEARVAFDRLIKEKGSVIVLSPIEGRQRSNTDLRRKSTPSLGTSSSSSSFASLPANNNNNNDKAINKQQLCLKITKYTQSDEISEIKVKYLELLEAYRLKILHDPVSALQMFSFINDFTKYKVRYGDVKKCYNYAIKHSWYKPMKRMKKIQKKYKKKITNNDNEGEIDQIPDKITEEYVLQIDHDKIEKAKQLAKEKEQKQQQIVTLDTMTDDKFDEILTCYAKKFHNPPRSASMIFNFVRDMDNNEFYKYKACRVAYARWKKIRNSAMPQVNDDNDNNNNNNGNDNDDNDVQVPQPGQANADADDNDDNDDNDDDDSDDSDNSD